MLLVESVVFVFVVVRCLLSFDFLCFEQLPAVSFRFEDHFEALSSNSSHRSISEVSCS